MKTSFISSLAVQTTMRNSIASAQRDLVDANTEAVSGRYADIGATLGARTSRAVDLTRELSRIESLYNTAALATQRLESAELSLSSMDKLVLDMQNAIITLGAATDETSLATARTTMSASLSAFTGFANTAVNGEYIFAGVNSDVKPMDDFLAPGSKAKEAFDRELKAFLAAQAPPLNNKTEMSKEQMRVFLEDIEKKFTGERAISPTVHPSPPLPQPISGTDFWTEFVSSASSDNMKSRIGPNEVVESSTNSNSSGMRYFALSAVVSMEFMETGMDKDARELVGVTVRDSFVSKAGSGLTQQRTTIGIYTERVSKAEESLQAQEDILTTHLGSLQDVDAAEAATRVNTLQTLLETAYSVTAKIQNLSLVNYL
jgi:flagellar hook-associated protein 3 FlgL